MKADVKVGDILVHSIGCGCDSFYQVVKTTDKTIKVHEIERKMINVNSKYQTHDYLPIKNKFCKTGFALTFTLRLHDNGEIGPSKRMMWWGVWDGKAKNQWSS